MKKKDLMVLVGVLVLSVVVSLIVSNFVFGSSSSRSDKVEVVDAISSDFPVDQVAPKYFNDQSIDPTQLIQIGNPNQNPFSGSSNSQ